ncbi:F-box domain-containing protein [Artemisia annua]|uniref:F-box domain-containing protein n=1 Tax=Artemisia annua TaxID=35608 RepID=A0A2U1NP13_ARTAN|nr:F-box domain-containing protein [Artemisia annua]
MVELPQDTLYNIFSRLPIESLARFRSVCKQWRKVINDPYLNKIRGEEEPIPISSLAIIKSITTVKAEKDPIFKFSREDLIPGFIGRLVIGFCNGLVLFNSKFILHHSVSYIVINPLSKQCHKLPRIKIRPAVRAACYLRKSGGIGYDDSTNTFKIVFVVQEIYSSKQDDLKLRTIVHVLGTHTWREISQVPSYCIDGECVFAHGCLYWLTDIDRSSPTEPRKVVWFDVKKEEFGLIDHLPKQSEVNCTLDHLIDLDGEVGFVCHYNDTRSIEMWIFKQEQWVMHCQIHPEPPLLLQGVRVSGFLNKDGDILLTTKDGLVVYRLKSGRIHEVEHEYKHKFDAQHIRMYRKSLCSIHGFSSIKN